VLEERKNVKYPDSNLRFQHFEKLYIWTGKDILKNEAAFGFDLNWDLKWAGVGGLGVLRERNF
jgi:hypothetical protein